MKKGSEIHIIMMFILSFLILIFAILWNIIFLACYIPSGIILLKLKIEKKLKKLI